MTCGIYKIIERETGKPIYIGQSRCCQIRWPAHRKQRWPTETHDYIIEIECPKDIDQELFDLLEIEAIDKYDTFRNGENKTRGGSGLAALSRTGNKNGKGNKGKKRTEEQRRAQSERRTGKSTSKKGRKYSPHPEETRNKQSEGMRAYWAKLREDKGEAK